MPTQQLQQLLTNGTTQKDFKPLAMALVTQGADITVHGEKGEMPTLLHILVCNNNDGINNQEIAELVALDSNVLKQQDCYGRTPLGLLMEMLARKKCSFDNFKQTAMMLVNRGADITVRGTESEKLSLLHILACNNDNGINNQEIAELAALDSDVLKQQDYYDRTPLGSLMDMLARKKCSFDNFKQTAMMLVNRGADITVRGTESEKPSLLHILVCNNDNGINNQEIAELAALDSNVLKQQDCYGRTPLGLLMDMLARKKCSFGNFKQIAMMLVYRGADILVRGTESEKPSLLHILVCNNDNGINNQAIAELVALDSNVLKQQDCYNRTPLGSLMDMLTRGKCSFDNFKQTAMFLASLGANTTIRDSNGEAYTLLGIFARDNYKNVSNQEIAILIDLDPTALKTVNPSHPVINLFYQIQAMYDYGEVLKKQGILKGTVVCNLAFQLKNRATAFFAQEAEQCNFQDFERKFSILLHSEDQKIGSYRSSLTTICANIAIALTGVGALFIALKLIHSKATQGRTLFFFQKNKTTSEEKIAAIDLALLPTIVSNTSC